MQEELVTMKYIVLPLLKSLSVSQRDTASHSATELIVHVYTDTTDQQLS